MQATTPMDPRALDAMMSYQLESYGNPHSRTHSYGWDTEAAVEKAREQVADLIGASPKEVLFWHLLIVSRGGLSEVFFSCVCFAGGKMFGTGEGGDLLLLLLLLLLLSSH